MDWKPTSDSFLEKLIKLKEELKKVKDINGTKKRRVQRRSARVHN